jgi:hypothetical protein
VFRDSRRTDDVGRGSADSATVDHPFNSETVDSALNCVTDDADSERTIAVGRA